MEELNATLTVPQDICDWIEPATLRDWVQEEVHKLDGIPGGAGVSKQLLAVLSFAYARGIFDSQEILGLCSSDPLFRSLCEGADFSLDGLPSTRHKERGRLITLTVRLLTRAVAAKFNTPVESLDPVLKRRLHEGAVVRVDNAIQIDRGGEE